MKVQMIQAERQHAADIARIGRLSFTDTFGSCFQNCKDLEAYLQYSYDVAKIARSIARERNVYFLALSDGQPAGFAKVKLDSLYEGNLSGSQMELQKIYVLPQFQRQGVGRALMKTVQQFAGLAQPDYLWLDAHVCNERAIAFYEKYGFTHAGSRLFTIGEQTFRYYVLSMAVSQGLLKAV